MIDEPLNIENIQRKIAEYQKRIRYNYSILQDEDLDDTQSTRILNENNKLKEMVYSLQIRLKGLYQEMFSGSKKQPVRTTYND